MRPYKYGNAFSDQRKMAEASGRSMTTPDQYSRGSVDTDATATNNNPQDSSITPKNSFDMLVGPITQTEQHGRGMTAEQRSKMAASLNQSPIKSLRTRSDTDNTTKPSKSERKPAQNLIGKLKTKLTNKKSRHNISHPMAVATAADMNKPLPSITTTADPNYNYLSIPSPASPGRRLLPPRPGDIGDPDRPDFDSPTTPDAMYFGTATSSLSSPSRTAAKATNWPLPSAPAPAPPSSLSSSPMPPPQIVHPPAPTRATAANRAAATTPTATLPSAVVLGNPGPRFLTPARTGAYASVGKGRLVAPAGPTVMSLKGSLAEAGSGEKMEEVVEGGEREGEEGDEGDEREGGERGGEGEGEGAVTRAEVKEVVKEVLKGELSALLLALDARLERMEARLARLEGAAGRVEGTLGRVEGLAREEKAQVKQRAAFGGRYPGDAKDLLEFRRGE